MRTGSSSVRGHPFLAWRRADLVRSTGPGGISLLCLAWFLASNAGDACATSLGNVAASVGLFAALAGLVLMQELPAHLPGSVLPTAAAALLVGGCAVWLLRIRTGRDNRLHAQPRALHAGPPAHRPASGCTPLAGLVDAGFDADALLGELRRQFTDLQSAWDRRDMAALRALTTAPMLEELCIEQEEADCRDGLGTEVVTLRADLLGFEAMPGDFLVSVEFSGLMRHSADRHAAPFREVWMLTRSRREQSAWRLARHQTLL